MAKTIEQDLPDFPKPDRLMSSVMSMAREAVDRGEELSHQLAQAQAEGRRLREALENIGRDHADDGYMLQKHIIHFPELERAVRHLRRQARAALAPDARTTAGACAAEHGGRREECAAWPACACPKEFRAPLVSEAMVDAATTSLFGIIDTERGSTVQIIGKRSTLRKRVRAALEAAVLALAGAGE